MSILKLTNIGGKLNPDVIDVTNPTFSEPIYQVLLDANSNNKYNTALGQNSLNNYYSSSIGTDNTAIGSQALKNNTNGSSNTAIGSQALQSNISGVNNTAIGYNSLPGSEGGNYNTAIGVNSMRSMGSNSHYNVAIGYDAGYSSAWGNDSYGITLLGAGTSINGVYQFSTAVGSTAQIKKSNQIVLGTANEVVTIPRFTGNAGVVHTDISGDLFSSLIVNSDISDNAITSAKIANGTIVGGDISNNTLTNNKFIGNNDTQKITAFGFGALQNNSATAHSNSAFGYLAGSNNRSPSGNHNTFLGSNADLDSSANGWFYSTAIGANSKITASNQIVLGNSNNTVNIPKFTTAGVVHNLANGSLTTSLIVAGDISDNAITSAKIANGAITSEKILDGTIVGSDISSNTITADNIANGTITSDKIADGTIVSGDISDNAVTTSKITDANVTADKLADNAVTSAKITDANVTTDKLADNAVTSAKLASNLDLSGNPTAPTQTVGDNSTKIATTAFVKNQSYITSSSLGVMNLSAPASLVAGSFYFDLSGNLFNVYTGTEWVSTTLSNVS